MKKAGLNLTNLCGMLIASQRTPSWACLSASPSICWYVATVHAPVPLNSVCPFDTWHRVPFWPSTPAPRFSRLDVLCFTPHLRSFGTLGARFLVDGSVSIRAKFRRILSRPLFATAPCLVYLSSFILLNTPRLGTVPLVTTFRYRPLSYLASRLCAA